MPARHRNPAGVAAHDFEHHHAVVALRGGAQAVQRVGGAGDGGIEAERQLRWLPGRCQWSWAPQRRARRVRRAAARCSASRRRPRTTRARKPSFWKLALAWSRISRGMRLLRRGRSWPQTGPCWRCRERCRRRRAARPFPCSPAAGSAAVRASPRSRPESQCVSQPRLLAHFTTARMTVFSPGQSPPPVRMPIRSRMGERYSLEPGV